MSGRELFAVVDAGTTGTRCCVVDRAGTVISGGYRGITTQYPNPGLAEQDPGALVEQTMEAVEEAVSSMAVDPKQIAGLCTTVQRNTFVPVGADGSCLTNLITWQDQRGEKAHSWILQRLKASGMTPEAFFRANGQPFGSFQCGFKALWLRAFQEELYNKTHKLVTPLGLLTHAFGAEGYPEERNNQSFWLMADADRQCIDEALCRIFDFDPDKFPEAFAPGTRVGSISTAASRRTGLIAGTPIYIGSGDQNCGALGAGNYGTTDIMSVCMGTAGLCIAYSPKPIRHPRGMCQIQGHPAGGYLMEAHSSSCMSSFRWVRELLFPGKNGAPGDDGQMAETAMMSPVGANGVMFLPWLQGAACPHYDDAARGAFIGMSLASGRQDLARAAMEGICFENRMMLETLREADLPEAGCLRVIGGASNSEIWNQMQADIYALPVETITAKEATVLGAAIVCAVAAGVYTDFREASDRMTHVLRRYEPRQENVGRYDEVYGMWNDCYADLSHRSFDRIYAFQTCSR